MTTAPTFASAREAAEVVRAGLGFLAAADATAMAAETQAQCLQILEQATAMSTAARASILAAFTTGQGYSADADYSPKAWLINRTRDHQGHRGRLHRVGPEGRRAPRRSRGCWPPGRSPSRYARMICTSGPTSCPGTAAEAADAILVAAAKAGRGRAGPGRAGRGDLRPVPARGPRQRPGSGVRGPVRQAGDHVRGRGRPDRRFDPAVRLGGERRCWTRCPPRRARRTPAVTPSGTTMRCTRRCSGW